MEMGFPRVKKISCVFEEKIGSFVFVFSSFSPKRKQMLSSLADVKVGGVYGIPSLCPIFVGKKSKMFSSE
jgi:hypothetical protein